MPFWRKSTRSRPAKVAGNFSVKAKPGGEEAGSVLNTSQGHTTSNGNEESAKERVEHETNATDDIAEPQARSAPSSPVADEDFSSRALPEEPSLPDRSVPHDDVSPLSDNNDTARLWREAVLRLFEDNSKRKIMDKYKDIAMPELINSGLAPNSVSPPDQQRVDEWLKKSESPSSKKGEILDNVSKALSFAAQLLSPAAMEPHVGLVYAGLCIFMQPVLNVTEQISALNMGLDRISLIVVRSNSVWEELQRKPGDLEQTSQVQAELKERVIKLYSGVIEFQAQAVCYFSKGRGKILYDLVKADDWIGLLGQINQSEKDCWDLINQINSDRSRNRSNRQDRLEQSQLLKELPIANAAFNDGPLGHKRKCHDNTRVKLRQDIEKWSMGRQDQFLFWLNGQAGTGKSTIALTVAQQFHNERRLGASFFFSRDKRGRDNAKRFFTTLASQLADLSPDLKYLISEAIANHRGIAGKQPSEQWNRLIIEPLRQCQSHWSPIVVVIDALDEYDSEVEDERDRDIEDILKMFIELKDVGDIRLRIFITSRPEIRNSAVVPTAIIHDVALHNAEGSEGDISLFLRDELSVIRNRRCPGESWPALEQIQRLTKNAGKLFIYAATACRFVDVKVYYRKRLSMILEGDTTGMEELDKMYAQILEQSVPHGSEDEKSRFLVSLRSIIGTIVVLSSPLSSNVLHDLLPRKIAERLDASINEYLSDLHSVLDVPDDRNLPIRVSHLSLREFLLDEKKCKNKDFWVSEQKAHRNLLNRCLEVMDSLTEDICGLQMPGKSRKDVEKETIDRYLPERVQYACLYWVYHLKGSKGNVQDGDHAHQFLRYHFLHWLEALSLIGRISDTVGLIDELQSMADSVKGAEASKFLHDAKRFVLNCYSAVDIAPLQLYSSALIFAPERSVVRETFQERIHSWITTKPVMEHDWSPCLRTLDVHSDAVLSVAFSHNSKFLASGSDDATIMIWDTVTGSLQRTLKGHNRPVSSVVFSHDSKLLASGSKDLDIPIVIWDIATGSLQRTLKGHSNYVSSVAFSHDSKILASGSDDKMIKIWDTATGSLQWTLEGHRDYVSSVTFSYDSKLLASGSDDKMIKIWDTATWSLQRTLEGHNSPVLSVTFSSDSKILASGSQDLTIKIWDTATGSLQRTLEGHRNSVSSIAFSHDSKLLASGSYDKTIRVWDTSTGLLQRTFEGHSDYVLSVAFSKLLASGSDDKMIKIWDTATWSLQRTLKGHSLRVWSIAFSYDSKLLASGSEDDTIKIWDTATGSLQRTLEGHRYRGTDSLVVFSYNSKLLASESYYAKIMIWDTVTGSLQQTLECGSTVRSFAFSHDSKLLASASKDKIKFWDMATGSLQRTLEGHNADVSSIVFSYDSKLLALGSSQNIEIWDIATGSLQRTLEHRGSDSSIAFSHDSKLLALGSYNKTIEIWNMATGSLQQMLNVGTTLRNISFDATGLYLLTEIGPMKLSIRADSEEAPVDVITGAEAEAEAGVEIGSSTSQPWLEPQPQSPSQGEAPRFRGCGMNAKKSWITWNGSNVLWLPPDYRPSASAIISIPSSASLSTTAAVALGCRSGRVLVFTITVPVVTEDGQLSCL